MESSASSISMSFNVLESSDGKHVDEEARRLICTRANGNGSSIRRGRDTVVHIRSHPLVNGRTSNEETGTNSSNLRHMHWKQTAL
jgi:hypothetical protein